MNKVKKFVREYRSLLLFTFLLMFFRTTYADWSPVPSSSMEPTIFPGDVVWVDKTNYGPSLPFFNKRLFAWRQPERGEIITFVPPHEDRLYVKRVIGIPGDSIHVERNSISVNGVRLEQSISKSTNTELIGTEELGGAQHSFKVSRYLEFPEFTGSIVVPDKRYFVMGDFRNNSGDSRSWGFVDEENIMGKVSAVAVSFSSQRHGASRLAIPIQ